MLSAERETAGVGLTVTASSAVAVPQEGVWSLATETVTMKLPLCVGVPPMVLPFQVTPSGSPVTSVTVALSAETVTLSMAVPWQTATAEADRETVGSGLTVTLAEAVAIAEHSPTDAVAVTEYVALSSGLTSMEAVVAPVFHS